MSTITQEEASWFGDVFGRITANVERALVGRPHIVRLAVACMFSQGHLLLEDTSGTGKTTLARAIARCVYGSQSRIQFTPDLRPSDITGIVRFDERSERYRLYPGPIFNSLVVADEINRAAPRTQSALLEVMEEGRVTVQGITNNVGPPFMVIATQNPLDNEGTFPLPEAQLDRFLMRVSIGQPDADAAMVILSESSVRDRTVVVEPILDPPTMARATEMVSTVYVDPELVAYVIRLIEATREADGVRSGVSIRGGLAIMRAAKTWAAANSRTHVLPQDLVELAQPVLGHRIALFPTALAAGRSGPDVVDEVLARVPVPAG